MLTVVGHSTTGSGGADSGLGQEDTDDKDDKDKDDTDEGRPSGTHPKRGIVDVVTDVGNRLTKRRSRPAKAPDDGTTRDVKSA
jgi:hypothetical protein